MTLRKISITCWGKVDVEGEYIYTGKTQPREQSKISVDVQDIFCSCDVGLLESQYLTCEATKPKIFGEAVSALDRALEIALSLMVDEESALLNIQIPGKYISDYLTELVVFTCAVCLKIVENGKLIFELTPKEKLALAVKYKNIGIGLYKEGSHAKKISAFFMFRDAIKWLSMIGSDETKDILGEFQAIKIDSYNNIALCHLHQHRYELSIAASTAALRIDVKNVKALYRRAVANTELQNYEIALDDIQAAFAIDSNNVPVKKQLEVIKRRQKAVLEKYAEAMKKLYS